MSASSISPPSTPVEPDTPPMPSPAVRITLPTPPSFSRRTRSQSVAPDSPHRKKPSSSDSPAASSDSGSDVGDDDVNARPGEIKEVEWKKGHGRSVSFHLPGVKSPLSPKNMSSGDTSREEGSSDVAPEPSPGLYRIPQRAPDYVPAVTPSPATSGEPVRKERKAPPRPLSLSPTSQRHIGPACAGISPRTRLGPMTAPANSSGNGIAPASRWSSTAAARGLSIAPALAKQRHSLSGAAAQTQSIWSASLTSLGALGASSGWISPALASARSTGTATRTRGLTAAVIKDGKEVLMETLPTPGLPSATHHSTAVTVTEESEGVEVLRDEVISPTLPISPALSSASASSGTRKPKEIILCRYYHTPGLTCTSRPCRFVHDLSTIGIVNGSVADYNMKSPTTANLSSAALSAHRHTIGGSPDFTSGTFAAFQAEARRKSLSVKDVDEKGIVPGEMVTVAAENGEEVEGMVFLMSGGGKGPVGKGKAKYKTVKCKDYAEGHCPYGDYCSFLHDEMPGPVQKTPGEEGPPKSATSDLKPLSPSTFKSDRRRSFDPAAFKKIDNINAWRKIPATVRQPPGPSVAIIPGALERHQQRLSAFAAPFLETPLIVGKTGELVQSCPDLDPTKDAVPNGPAPLAEQKINIVGRPGGSADVNQQSASAGAVNGDTSALGENKNAWHKGPPPALKKVLIGLSLPSAQVQTLTVPTSATSLFGTESDPATPWDPAVRETKLAAAEAPSGEKRNPEYPPTATYVQPVPDSEYTYLQQPYSYGTGAQNMPYPFNAPAYPWGMPMSPVGLPGADDPAHQHIPGGPGVMWTPAGWAVQDAAMKMALLQAEVNRGGHNGVTRESRPKTYWRTKKCKFFADGNCPHGESCTYIHELPTAAEKARALKSTSAASRGTAGDGKSSTTFQTLPCKFFNSAIGCLNGDACAFLHTLVVPDSVQLVDKPRPWRTRPCRHFQVGRCHLGDACHFAHVYEGENGVDANRQRKHEPLTQESLARAMEEGKRRLGAGCKEDDDEDSDDDVEIVTEDTSTISPPRSVAV